MAADRIVEHVESVATRDMPELLGVGCITVDELLYVDRYPPPDEKQRISRSKRKCGGLTAAALVAAAAQGVRSAFGGRLGEDELSRFAMNELEQSGVSLDFARIDPAARPIKSTIVVDSRGGTRNIFYDLEGVHPLPPDWPAEDVLHRIKGLIVDHYNVDAQIRAARIARDRGIPVVADFERNNVDRFDELLGFVNHVVLSEKFAQRLTGQQEPHAAARALWHPERQAVIITRGERGCVFCTAESPQVASFPAYRVKEIDTTGCGDVFHGVYAASLIRGESICEAIRQATAAAAIKAAAANRFAAPTTSEISEFLAEQP